MKKSSDILKNIFACVLQKKEHHMCDMRVIE